MTTIGQRRDAPGPNGEIRVNRGQMPMLSKNFVAFHAH
jgi:hypothetical protein